jgi:hypothetical protein
MIGEIERDADPRRLGGVLRTVRVITWLVIVRATSPRRRLRWRPASNLICASATQD